MKRSPLQLLHSHFAGLSLVALDVAPDSSDANTGAYPEVPEDAVETKVELGMPTCDADDPHQFLLRIGISSTKSLPSAFPYRFAAQIEGIFRIEHDGDLNERKRLVLVNGGSMLFGIVREQILILSLRHKNGPLLLPSLDFRGLVPSAEQDASAQRVKARRRKPPVKEAAPTSKHK